MDAKERHHQHHEAERRHEKAERKEHEHEEEEQVRTIHPLWFVALGCALIALVIVVWTFLI
jgi:hypothetical protein